ncbi:MAG TPA: FAD-dependent oxidoreductase [Caldimonas sp.]|nr:FAD-dependent oxidoreductase [Caldimonas sp.]HEV7574621.1 FAD-dependent oxidoreductase [Caldimonas sp.]
MTEAEAGSAPAPPPAGKGSEDPIDALVDEALVESFPASDPPAWTLGTDLHVPAPSPPSPAKPAPLVRVYGRLGNPQAYAIRDFLHRSDIPFEWIHLDNNADARRNAGVDHLRDARLPVCEFSDGTRMEAPSIRQITEKLGWFRNPSRAEYDLAIYGAGPAGLSAAVYAAADGLSTVLVERWAPGGQAASSSKIENYLGFPDGISGRELAERARDQACKFGVEILIAREGVGARIVTGRGVGILEDGTQLVARASICATGVAYRCLGLPGEDRLLGAGLYYGAGASEAPLTRGENVVVVGGANSAGQAALHFAPFACRVTIVVRGPSLKETLSRYLLDRIIHTANIDVLTQTEVVGLHGDRTLDEITLRDNVSGRERRMATRWLFVCIGGEPQTHWAETIGIVLDEGGYIVTGPDLAGPTQRPVRWPLDRDPYFLESSLPGVFASGDVRHNAVRRVASAAGEGAMAVAFVHRFLEGN